MSHSIAVTQFTEGWNTSDSYTTYKMCRPETRCDENHTFILLLFFIFTKLQCTCLFSVKPTPRAIVTIMWVWVISGRCWIDASPFMAFWQHESSIHKIICVYISRHRCRMTNNAADSKLLCITKSSADFSYADCILWSTSLVTRLLIYKVVSMKWVKYHLGRNSL